MRRCTHTYDDIISTENLLEAWREFKRGKRKRVDVQEFEHHLMDNIHTLHEELVSKRYIHGTYEHFVVNDPKRRDIHKATVRDRLLHHALYRILYPYFDTKFIHDSYSCRNHKGTHRALGRFEYFTRRVSCNYTKQCFVLKCDIRKFFASIDHEILLTILRKYIDNEDILWLLSRIITSFEKGLPLGNLTSQLLVNIYMHEFDHYVKHDLRVQCYIRYADDFVFVSGDREYLENILQKCDSFFKDTLALSLHPNKVSITTIYSGIDFLGWVHFPHHRVLRTVTKRRMLKKVCPKNVSSYLGMLTHGNGHILGDSIGLISR